MSRIARLAHWMFIHRSPLAIFANSEQRVKDCGGPLNRREVSPGLSLGAELRRMTAMSLFQRLFVPFHVFVYRLSGGRLLGRLGGLPVLLLTTTGRRSGKRRTMPLLYLEEDGALVVVASAAGAPRNPAWYGNLVANATVQVHTRDGRLDMLAETAADEDRQRLYDRFKAASDQYAGYETKTDRKIPIVLLRAAG